MQDQEYDGWESSFPKWQSLIALAAEAMGDDCIQYFNEIEFVWQISEETEDLAERAEKALDEWWDCLTVLSRSSKPEVRWQVYYAIRHGGARAARLLESRLKDGDSYCRRRAALALVCNDVRMVPRAIEVLRDLTFPGRESVINELTAIHEGAADRGFLDTL